MENEIERERERAQEENKNKYIRSFGDTEEEKERFCLGAIERAAQVKAKIKDECARTGRECEPILMAATKTVSAEVINRVCAGAGIRDIGENRVQELLAKYDELDPSLRVHFIGTLQRNKVKYIVGKVALIHSVDSIGLAREIGLRSCAMGITTDVLIEVNTGREKEKGGVYFEEIDAFADEILAIEGIRLRGLMAVAPKESENQDYYKYFEETYHFFIDFLQKKLHNINDAVLSMGMSESYIAATACGSTLVRVGSAIFGERQNNK